MSNIFILTLCLICTSCAFKSNKEQRAQQGSTTPTVGSSNNSLMFLKIDGIDGDAEEEVSVLSAKATVTYFD